MTIRAMLFDMDGLLIDTEGLHLRASSETATQLGFERRPDEFLDWIGRAVSEWAQWMLAQSKLDATPAEIDVLEKKAFLRMLHAERPEPLPGVKEMLAVCDELELKRGLVSTTRRDMAHQVMDVVLAHLGRRAGLEHHFHTVITGEMVENKKPAPDPYLLAAERLALAPAACLAFEDSPLGVQSAVAAGCMTVVIPNRYLKPEDFDGQAHASFPTLLDAYEAKVWERF